MSLLSILVTIEAETLAWFQAQGEDCEKRMAALPTLCRSTKALKIEKD
ncbi:hypothetical protein [Scytonema sp. NUACC26]